jgi:predicted RNA-binding protein with PIN domain
MNYIIDGHNLIAKLAGLSLSMLDDEQRLVELLIRYCQIGRHKVEVYFDRAPAGQARTIQHGRVKAHFVSQRSSADDAIRKRLHSSGKIAGTWIVVTSDRSVQLAAREVRAQVLRADEFARQLENSLQDAHPQHTGEDSQDLPADRPLSEAEVREWEAIFKGQRKPD